MKGHIRVIAVASSGLLALALAASPAAACSCQKEYMIKKYGTLSALGDSAPAAPAPTTTPPPTAPAGTQTGG